MLVLTRRVHEEIVINGDIHITVLEAQPGRVRIGVRAPASVSVDREEIHARKINEVVSARSRPRLAVAPGVRRTA